jgi:hypothetical protein
MQLVIIVELKSGGGCNLARSSTTDAESIAGQKVDVKEKKTRIVAEMEGAMAVCIYIVGVIKRRTFLIVKDH